MHKWQGLLETGNVLQQYKARQFIDIISKSEVLEAFDLYLYFAFVEKMTIYDNDKLKVTLIDETEIECEKLVLVYKNGHEKFNKLKSI